MAEIRRYLELSTAHVTEEVAKELDRIVQLRAGHGHANPDDWQYWIVAERWSTYGWWIWPNVEDGLDQLPDCLRACFRYATDHGCRWILFDCDAEIEPALPTYEW